MSTQNFIKVQDNFTIFFILSYRKNSVGSPFKRFEINHGKQAIVVRTIDVRLYNVQTLKPYSGYFFGLF